MSRIATSKAARRAHANRLLSHSRHDDEPLFTIHTPSRVFEHIDHLMRAYRREHWTPRFVIEYTSAGSTRRLAPRSTFNQALTQLGDLIERTPRLDRVLILPWPTVMGREGAGRDAVVVRRAPAKAGPVGRTWRCALAWEK